MTPVSLFSILPYSSPLFSTSMIPLPLPPPPLLTSNPISQVTRIPLGPPQPFPFLILNRNRYSSTQSTKLVLGLRIGYIIYIL